MYACMHACMYVCMNMYIHIYIYIRTRLFICSHKHIRTQTHINIYIYLFIYLFTYIYIHTYTHIYTYLYIYILYNSVYIYIYYIGVILFSAPPRPILPSQRHNRGFCYKDFLADRGFHWTDNGLNSSPLKMAWLDFSLLAWAAFAKKNVQVPLGGT